MSHLMNEGIEKMKVTVEVGIYMLFSGWEVRIVKNCDRAGK